MNKLMRADKIKYYKIKLRYDLSFFADKDEKTEQPTAKKKRDARNEGQVAQSQEVGTAFLFFAVFFAFRLFATSMYQSLLSVFYYFLNMIRSANNIFDKNFIAGLIVFVFQRILLISMPIFAVAMIVGIVSNLIQVGWNPTSKPLKPKFNKLNPISGFKRLFSFTAVVALIKSLGKFAVIALVIYNMVEDELNRIALVVDMGILQATMFFGDIVIRMGLNVALFYLFIALADYAYTRYKHNKDLKMSKQEVKDEYKNMEGNPQIKGKIRQKMREASMRRMMQEVPQADVIITNPTHYAVALRYERNSARAPIVIAKGVDFLAKKIRDAAIENKIEIVENIELARTLYATVDIGKEIPPQLYQAVAEILAFVYKLKNKS